MVQIVGIRNVTIIMFLQYLPYKHSNSDTPSYLGQSETHSLAAKNGNRVVGEDESLIALRRSGLHREPPCHFDAFSSEFRTVDDEELEFEEVLDVFV